MFTGDMADGLKGIPYRMQDVKSFSFNVLYATHVDIYLKL